jgi:hypothetical protein
MIVLLGALKSIIVLHLSFLLFVGFLLLLLLLGGLVGGLSGYVIVW